MAQVPPAFYVLFNDVASSHYDGGLGTVMKRLADMSLRVKLILIIMLGSMSILLFVSTAFILQDIFFFRQAVRRELDVRAGILGINSIAPMLYDDRKAATENLRAMEGDPHILAAWVLDTNGTVFATYGGEDSLELEPPAFEKERTVMSSPGQLTVVRPIVNEGLQLGYIVIASNLQELYDRLRQYALLVGVVFLLSSLLALLISNRLQAVVSRPIMRLSRIMTDITNKQNYSIRVKPQGRDEVGALYEGFNRMLEGIEAGTKKLTFQIEQRKYAEAALLKSEQNLSITLNSIADAVVVTDTVGHIIRLNPVAESLIGKDIRHVYGSMIDEVLRLRHAQTGMLLVRPAAEVYSAGHAFTEPGPLLMDSLDDKEYRVTVSGAPIRETSGQLLGAVLVLHDVTDQEQMEQQLRQSQKMQALGQLTGGVAHDFNNMLGGIMGAASLIEMELDAEHPCREYLSLIHNATDRASAMIKQMLVFSRNEKSSNEPVDLHEVIDSVMKLLKHTMDPRIEICIQLQAEKPMTMGDPVLLQSALLNIAVNARDAMVEGGQLSFTTWNMELSEEFCSLQSYPVTAGTYLVVSIIDTGCGMDAKTRERIFEPFFTTKDPGKGTGLGLSAVYGIVKEHKGIVNVYSELGRGSEFKLFLKTLEPGSVQGKVSQEQWIEGSGRILLVDDEEILLSTADSILTKMGYQVTATSSPIAALDILEKDPRAYDLVILDMVMPDMSGLELYQKMTQRIPNLPAIFASGFAHTEELEEIRSRKEVAFISKPYRKEALSSVVHKVLHHC